jgi:hypothetical protein
MIRRTICPTMRKIAWNGFFVPKRKRIVEPGSGATIGVN